MKGNSEINFGANAKGVSIASKRRSTSVCNPPVNLKN